LGDYLSFEDFQIKCIKHIIIPRIISTNCLIFLNEALNKIKACEESQNAWFLLLNTAMSQFTKEFLYVYSIQNTAFLKTNRKFLNEVC